MRLVASLTVVLFAGGTTTASLDAVRELTETILADGGVHEIECPKNLSKRLRKEDAQVCAWIEMEPARIRPVWDTFMQGHADRYEIVELEPWSREAGIGKLVSARIWLVEGTPLTVYVDEKTSRVALRYSTRSWNEWPCDELHARSGIYRYGDEGLTYAKVLKNAPAEYPEAARVIRAKGTVVVHAIVNTDGTVSDLCIARVHYEDLGFEKAAVDAVLQYAYEPATLDGRPVPVWTQVWVEFSAH